MNKELLDMINIGLPCYSSIELPLFDLTLSCALDKSKSIKVEREIRHEAIEKVDKIIGNTSLNRNEEYLSTINFYADDTSNSVFNLDEKQRYVNLFNSLTDLNRNDDNITILNEKLNILHNLVYYLKSNTYSKSFYEDFKRLFPYLCNGKNYSCDLRSYISNQYDRYEKMICSNLDDILSINFSDLLESYVDTLNPEKAAFFLAIYYLKHAFLSIKKGDLDLANEYLFYLSAYFKLNKKDISMYIYNKEYTYSYLKETYNNLLLSLNNLKDIYYDRRFFLGKEKEDNKNVINSLLNMETIKVRELFVKRGNGEGLTHEVKESTSRSKLTYVESRAVITALDEKEYVYLKNNPVAKIVCENKFSNYIAFLYKNGIILADRFRGVHRLSELKQDAIYVFNTLNFEEKIRHTKTELIHNTPRIFHIDGWEEKVSNLSKQETTDEIKNEVEEIILRKKL